MPLYVFGYSIISKFESLINLIVTEKEIEKFDEQSISLCALKVILNLHAIQF